MTLDYPVKQDDISLSSNMRVLMFSDSLPRGAKLGEVATAVNRMVMVGIARGFVFVSRKLSRARVPQPVENNFATQLILSSSGLDRFLMVNGCGPAKVKSNVRRMNQSPVGHVFFAYGVLNIVVKTDGRSVTPSYETLTEYILTKYPQAPLSIDMYDWNGLMYDSLSQGLDRRVIAQLCGYLDLFYSVVHRWQSVRFDAPLISLLVPKTSTRFPSIGPTILQSIAIKDTESVKDLETLRRFMSLLWYRKPWVFSQLSIDNYRSFHKKIFLDLPYSRLTHLEIQSTITGELAHEILQEALYMKRCTFSDVTTPGPAEERLPAVVPTMEYLKLEIDTRDFEKSRNTGAVFGLLEKILSPDLTELHLGYEDGWNTHAFSDFHSKSRCKIETLHLVKMAMKPRHLVQTLAMNPYINELVVEGQSKRKTDGCEILFTDDVLDRFMFDPHGNHLCPDLESLTVNVECVQVEHGKFRRMLWNRFQNSNLREVKIIGSQHLKENDRRALLDLASYRMNVVFDGKPVLDPRWL
ncbi:hypothetical protein BDZ97DRAFT_1921805 [Flammula alnicola]|nr:hypothetical protein BDZ97DRAFT_1921805 [Flammula alnicola]